MSIIDNTRITHNGVEFRIDLHQDDVTPEFYGTPGTGETCYDKDDARRFRDGHWTYVVVIVTPVVAYVDIDLAAMSIGGVEYGVNGNVWSIGVDDIAKQAIDGGWCDEAADNLRDCAADIVGALRELQPA